MYAAETSVPVAKTRAEIEALLGKHKAKQYGTAVDFDLRKARVEFRLADRTVRFVISLPEGSGARFEKAERQRWRALLLVIKAKLESVESQIETFEHAFLAQIVVPGAGGDRTVGDLLTPALKSGRWPKELGPAPPAAEATK